MRTVPPDVTLESAPPDFAPTFTDDGQVIAWRGTIGGKQYVLGLRPARTAAALAAAHKDLRNGVWQLMELQRIGRQDLMQYGAADRHANRKKA